MSDLKYFKIKNWEKYQHYKGHKRNMTWIKLYRNFCQSKTWVNGNSMARCLVIVLLTLCDESGILLYDVCYIRVAGVLGDRNGPVAAALDYLLKTGFIELIAGIDESVASNKREEREKIREEEIREKKSETSMTFEEKRRIAQEKAKKMMALVEQKLSK